jgi:hypothetical protein
VVNCLITESWAIVKIRVFIEGKSYPKLTNCTIAFNKHYSMNYNESDSITANDLSDDTIDNYFLIGIKNDGKGFVSLTNCIMWYNMSTVISGKAKVTYSDIEGGYTGKGNINSYPLFAIGPYGEYYLSQMVAGQLKNSPCVDAGTEVKDFDFSKMTTRTDGKPDTGKVDMGYHYPTGI